MQTAKEDLLGMHKALSLLERLAEMVLSWSVTGGRPMILDCVLAAMVRFAKGVYGIYSLEEHPRPRKVMEALERRGSTVGKLESGT